MVSEKTHTFSDHDIEQDKNTTELRREFDLLKVTLAEREKAAAEREDLREKAGKKIDWKVLIAATSLAIGATTGIGGTFMSLYIGEKLSPLKTVDAASENKIAVLERDLAVISERVGTASSSAISAAEKLVGQQKEEIDRLITRKEALRDKVEDNETAVNEAVRRDFFDEKLETLAMQRQQAIEGLRSLLSEDIERIGTEESETQVKLDDLEAALALTLSADDFEQRFNFISQQRQQDLDFLNQQRQDDRDARDRIITGRITEFIDQQRSRIERMEGIVLGPAWNADRAAGGGK